MNSFQAHLMSSKIRYEPIYFVECASKDGMDVTLEVWPGMVHVFRFMASIVSKGRQAIGRRGEFIKNTRQESV